VPAKKNHRTGGAPKGQNKRPKAAGGKAWRLFEQSVERLFRTAGFYVEGPTEQEGFEFDLIATREEFANLRTRIAVECKHRSQNASAEDLSAWAEAHLSRA